MDGYDSVQALKADPRTAGIPVVFLTGGSVPTTSCAPCGSAATTTCASRPEPAELLARVERGPAGEAAAGRAASPAATSSSAMSRTDFLTGLNNRRHLEEHHAPHRRRREAARLPPRRAARRRRPLQAGERHPRAQAGDDVLVADGPSARAAALRTEDVLGRWGGEEFLVLLPPHLRAAASVLGDRLRAVVSGDADPHARAARSAVTISVGGAAAERAGEHDLLRLADEQLYAAKDAGRDRVLVAASRASAAEEAASSSRGPGGTGTSPPPGCASTSPSTDRRTGRSCCCCTGSPSSGGPGGTSSSALGDAGFHAVAPDLRGYGATRQATPGVRRLHAVGRRRRPRPRAGRADDAHVVGHDWGGALGLVDGDPAPAGRQPAHRRCPCRTRCGSARRC